MQTGNIFESGKFVKFHSTLDVSADFDDMYNIKTTISHTYGNELLIPKHERVWVKYPNISFLRNVKHDKRIVQIVSSVTDMFKFLDVSDIKDVGLIRTSSNIPPHTDENRTACINIGILNADAADVIFTDKQFTLRDGEFCLFNSKATHTVKHTRNETRYLLSISLTRPFEDYFEKVTAYS